MTEAARPPVAAGQSREVKTCVQDAVPWPAFDTDKAQMLSLVPPRPRVETDFAAGHRCAFWAAG